MPFDVISKLYDTMLWSTISNDKAIWETLEFVSINAVQNRASRFFLGIGKYSQNIAVNGEMGWIGPYSKERRTVVNHWIRLNSIDDNRLINEFLDGIPY